MSCRTLKSSSAILTYATSGTCLDNDQAVKVFHTLKTRLAKQEESGKSSFAPPSQNEYEDFLDRSIWRTKTRDDLTDRQRESVLRRLEAAYEAPIPDAITFAAMNSLVDEMAEAETLYKREFQYLAGARGVTVAEARDYVDRTRKEWIATPRENRKYAPAEWVDLYSTHNNAYRRTSLPMDQATVYAVWKAETDPDAFPDTTTERGYVVFDLETTGFDPNRDDIIEVGAIFLRADGSEEGRESLLFSPKPQPDGSITTGAQDVHRITPDMVAGQPHFREHAERLRAKFEGRTLVGHNVPFDYEFIQSHFSAAGVDPLPEAPLYDTWRQARLANLPTANMKLATVAEHFGVNYTDGHRAEHDADVCRLVMRHLNGMPQAA